MSQQMLACGLSSVIRSRDAEGIEDMRNTAVRLIVVLTFGLALFQSVGSVVAVNDTTPPVFQSLSVSPTTVAAGSNFTVTARITDDISGVDSINLPYVEYRFSGPSGQIISAPFNRTSGTAQDGTYQAFVNVPTAYPSGTYYIYNLSAYDAASNHTSVQYPTPPTTSGTITVYDPTIPAPAPNGRPGPPPSGLPAPPPMPTGRSQPGATGSAPAPMPTHR